MKFYLIDRILRFDSRKRVCAVKGLSLAEEYLADHFPGNPVMPGVFMLEAMLQAGAMLLGVHQDFSFSMYSLKEVSNIRYAKFLMPGKQLVLEVELTGIQGNEAHFSGSGKIEDRTAVVARWVVKFFNLAEEDSRLARNDRLIVEWTKERFRMLGGEECWRQMLANVS